MILTREDLIRYLKPGNPETLQEIIDLAHRVRLNHVGNKVWLRGLVEWTNRCAKNCYYCGIRRDNKEAHRYTVDFRALEEAIDTALSNKFGSMVVQTGELSGEQFVEEIGEVVKTIKSRSDNKLGVTLSCGEQSEETYRYWYECGAHRYLLRIEASDPELYSRLHPQDRFHEQKNRFISLELLRKCGYQVGTGIMVGLPGQSLQHLADDILTINRLDVDMVGLGPYIPHHRTPLYELKELLLPAAVRLELTLRVLALVRITMKDINMAASTALDVLVSSGRLMALRAGANVLMPNLTPADYRKDYFLYDDKPWLTEALDLVKKISGQVRKYGLEIGSDEWGDAPRFAERNSKKTTTGKLL